jgi:hypothetical protein
MHIIILYYLAMLGFGVAQPHVIVVSFATLPKDAATVVRKCLLDNGGATAP